MSLPTNVCVFVIVSVGEWVGLGVGVGKGGAQWANLGHHVVELDQC